MQVKLFYIKSHRLTVFCRLPEPSSTLPQHRSDTTRCIEAAAPPAPYLPVMPAAPAAPHFPFFSTFPRAPEVVPTPLPARLAGCTCRITAPGVPPEPALPPTPPLYFHYLPPAVPPSRHAGRTRPIPAPTMSAEPAAPAAPSVPATPSCQPHPHPVGLLTPVRV